MDARRHKHVKRATALTKLEQAEGQFYFTGLCNIDFEQALDRLQTNNYGKKYAIDVFRYCYFFESDNCKEICNFIISEFGFGLRNKRSNVRAKRGYVFVYTSPYKKIETKRHIKTAFTKGEGTTHEKRMRSDDRLAMTSMRFHRSSPQQLASFVTNREHYLGSITHVANEHLMRKRVISMKPMMNKRVDEIFTDCYIAMSDNVRRDMAYFFDKVGNIGLRHKRAVSKSEPGGVYLLLKKGAVQPIKEQENLLTKFAHRVDTEPVPSPSHRAKVTHHRTASKRTNVSNQVPPAHRAKIIQPLKTRVSHLSPLSHRARITQPSKTRVSHPSPLSQRARITQPTKTRVVRTKKRKRAMDVTDTTKWVQMKKSAHATELSSRLRSMARARQSDPVIAAAAAASASTESSEEERRTSTSTTHSILSEKIKEVLCKHRSNLNFLTPKKVRREVEALLGYEKGGLDPKKAWMKTKLEEIHKKLLAGDL